MRTLPRERNGSATEGRRSSKSEHIPLSPPYYAKASYGRPHYLANGALARAQLAAKASVGK
jgi:hypothetical protein